MSLAARLLFASLGFVSFLLVPALPAAADIYTWTDATGRVNISNLPPPPGVKPVKVVVEHPLAPGAAEAEATARASQLAALSSRVRQLELELAHEREVRDAPVPAALAPAYPVAGYCDPELADCGAVYTPYYGPALVVVSRAGRNRYYGRGTPFQSVRRLIAPHSTQTGLRR